LNYRINLTREEIIEKIGNNNIEEILKHDQLLIQQKKGKIFQDIVEEKINFIPTFKYDVGKIIYSEG
jgi:hypothetical protein